MARLRVREIAEAQRLNLSQLQKKAAVTMPSVRRYWYNTKDGKSEGEQLREVDLVVLEAIARALGVHISELFARDNEKADSAGNSRPMLLAA